MTRRKVFLGLALSLLATQGFSNLGFINLPKGFEAEVLARVPGARQMALGSNGLLVVGTRSKSIYAFNTNQNIPIVGDFVVAMPGNFNSPNGVALHNGTLFVAEIDRILAFPNIEAQLSEQTAGRSLRYKVLNDTFPSDRHHGWKYIKVGPDGRLYAPVGAPCNICEPNPKQYASLFAIDLGSGRKSLYAQGIRNTVGFAWHPTTKTLYFTDNGRDFMGDELPPDELNAAPRRGLHFGYPYLHGTDIRDPKYGHKAKPADYTSPVYEFRAHVAALGMDFYTGRTFPKKYQNQIFVAQHGSWNRSRKIGYRVVVVFLPGSSSGKKASMEVFASGWLDDETQRVSGRPVDVLATPEGDLLVSDDHQGTIYRIRYVGRKNTQKP